MERARLKSLALSTGCAVERGPFVFLQNPNWGTLEQAQAEAFFAAAEAFSGDADEGWLCIPTGGSSGRVRFVRHDEKTLGAAVRGFCTHFCLQVVNTLGVLPPFHVSGLMARLRSISTGGRHLEGSWKELERGVYPKLESGDWVLSLVPTQLQRLMSVPSAVEWLRAFRIIFIGGAPLWQTLAEAAAEAHLPLSLGYGSTETGAMATGLQPEEFLLGQRNSGRPLAHARIEILDTETKQLLTNGEIGLVRVSGESLFRGYFPEMRDGSGFLTEDLGFIDGAGRLHIASRADAVIITGGEKVFPFEVETVLRASGQFTEIAVLGLPHPEWGEAVVACYPSAEAKSIDWATVDAALKRLAPFKRPKWFIALPTWPRNDQGKLNRAALRSALALAEPNPFG